MNIVDEIARRADGGRTAIIAGDASLSYDTLLGRAGQAAAWLEQQPGFHREGVPRVGLACPNGVEYIVLALGILKAGACLVPIADELTDEEREELIQRTGLHGLILDDGSGAKWQPLETTPLENEAAFSKMEPAFIRFSSGTTGRSKGVVISHTKLLERITAANAGLEISPDDRVLWMLPMAHHFAVSIVLYLYHGACTVLGESHLADEVLKTAETTRATVIYGSPFHHSLLAADAGGYSWPDLRLAVSTAAPLTAATAEKFLARFGKPLVQGLGIIEVGLPLLNTRDAADSPTAIGRPLPAFAVELRDDNGLPVSTGNVGELWIKGPGMFDAYLSPWQPAAEVFTDGWFATGDLAEMTAYGTVFLRGRKKSVLNVGGMKVFPEEIEAVLDRHPAVRRSRVSGLDHPILGTVPVAEIIAEAGAEIAAKDLITWCKRSLSAFKVPVRVKFTDALPLTASGKIRRF